VSMVVTYRLRPRCCNCPLAGAGKGRLGAPALPRSARQRSSMRLTPKVGDAVNRLLVSQESADNAMIPVHYALPYQVLM